MGSVAAALTLSGSVASIPDFREVHFVFYSLRINQEAESKFRLTRLSECVNIIDPPEDVENFLFVRKKRNVSGIKALFYVRPFFLWIDRIRPVFLRWTKIGQLHSFDPLQAEILLTRVNYRNTFGIDSQPIGRGLPVVLNNHLNNWIIPVVQFGHNHIFYVEVAALSV
jgi:hypothetical protein